MLINSKLLASYIMLCSFCFSQTEAMESECEREGALSSHMSKFHEVDDKAISNHFDTSESTLSSNDDFQFANKKIGPIFGNFNDLELFRRSLLKMKSINDHKFTINIDGYKYFIDKKEEIIAEFHSDSPLIMPAGLISMISKAKLVDVEVVKNPRRVRFFYDIQMESYGFMPQSSRKYKRVKMTRLGGI